MIATGVWVVLAGLLGLAIGSFLNVVIYRVPAGLSIVRPPSSCPRCGTEIRIRHNIPVLGWLMLRGRCYDCHEPISPRYPIVEALTGLLFAVLTARLVQLHLSPAVAAYLVLAAAVVTLTMVEFDQGRLYGGITLTAAAMTAALLVAASIGSGAWWPLLRAAVAAVLVTGVGLAAVFACGRAVRVDAVEFAGLLAATLAYRSWTTLLVGAAIAAVLSGVAGAIGEYRHRRLQRFAVPFVACLVVAALTALMLPEL